jgi:hypothetical protein
VKATHYLIYAGAIYYPTGPSDLQTILPAATHSHEQAVESAHTHRQNLETWGAMPEYSWAAVTTVYDDLTFEQTHEEGGEGE